MFKEKTNELQTMNTQKMSYFSDIDLATLHRTRLNERIQYKLSWFNRRQKYYIPPTTKQTYKHRDNQKSIKTYANQQFGADHKKSCKTNAVHSNKHNAANGQKNGTLKNPTDWTQTTAKTTTTDTNGPIRNSTHCDNSTKDVHYDEITKFKNNASIDGNKTNSNTIKNHVNDVNRPLADINVPSVPSVALASLNPDSMKTNPVKHNTMDIKCLPGDAINKNARVTTNQTNNIENTCISTSKQNVEEDLKVPHRKRSGTWP